MRYLVLLATSCYLSSCALWPWHKDAPPTAARLQSDKAILIATPNDGTHDNGNYPYSGKVTALVIQSAFARHASNVALSAACTDLNCLESNHASPADYYVVPEILHWEDQRSPEWSRVAYKLEIKLMLYDAHSGKNLATKIVSHNSGWFTIGEESPQNLLAKPINKYVTSLY